jgi:hypothetical protein
VLNSILIKITLIFNGDFEKQEVKELDAHNPKVLL